MATTEKRYNARSHVGFFRRTSLVTAFLVGVVVVSTGEPAIVVRGISLEEGRPYASVESTITGEKKWISHGQEIEGWALKALDFIKKQAYFSAPDGRVEIVTLQDAVIISDNDQREAWIRSRLNPMFFRPVPLSLEARLNWYSLPQAQKEKIVAFYRNYGWELKVEGMEGGIGVRVSYRPVHVEQQLVEMRAEFSRFRDSLAPADADAFTRLYLAGTAAKLVSTDNISGTQPLSAEAQRKFDEFSKALISPPTNIKHP